MKQKLFLALVPIAALFGLALGAAGPDYTSLDDKAEPLKSAFNADAGKIRVVMLVAPT